MVSIYKSCRHRDRALEEARSLTDTIVQKLASKIRNGQINVKDISRFTQVALNRFDKAASTYYSVRHQ